VGLRPDDHGGSPGGVVVRPDHVWPGRRPGACEGEPALLRPGRQVVDVRAGPGPCRDAGRGTLGEVGGGRPGQQVPVDDRDERQPGGRPGGQLPGDQRPGRDVAQCPHRYHAEVPGEALGQFGCFGERAGCVLRVWRPSATWSGSAATTGRHPQHRSSCAAQARPQGGTIRADDWNRFPTARPALGSPIGHASGTVGRPRLWRSKARARRLNHMVGLAGTLPLSRGFTGR